MRYLYLYYSIRIKLIAPISYFGSFIDSLILFLVNNQCTIFTFTNKLHLTLYKIIIFFKSTRVRMRLPQYYILSLNKIYNNTSDVLKCPYLIYYS